MAGKRNSSDSKRNGPGGKLLPVLCNVIGIALLLGVIVLSIPLAVPRIAGYQVFDVVSGSMEPEIPQGSMVVVQDVDPVDVEVGDVIAFREGGGITVHRVTTNRTSLGEFVTKGDANNVEDLRPVPYSAVVGRVTAHVPQLGDFMDVYSSAVGKAYLLLTAACGVMFNVLAGFMRRSRKAQLDSIYQAAEEVLDVGADTKGAKRAAQVQTTEESHMESSVDAQSDAVDGARAARGAKRQKSPKRWSYALRNALMAILAVVFVGSSAVVAYVTWQYHISDQVYSGASEAYTLPTGPVAPKSVDFDALCAENPDVVGWIYCEGTVIDYPVLRGKDNDQYLYHDYTGAYNIDGSIFVDADNAPKFADSNTIIYGHHMNSGSMFASLEKWADQEYYEEHPVIWLLTPEQDYAIVLFSGRHISARSDAYDIISKPGKELEKLLTEAVEESDFTLTAEQGELVDASATEPGAQLDTNAHYVMLSTCAYVFDNARYVLHGQLVPVISYDDAVKDGFIDEDSSDAEDPAEDESAPADAEDPVEAEDASADAGAASAE